MQSLGHFASGDTGLSALGINLEAYLVQLATFVLFLVLLEKFAIKPLIKRLEARRKLINDGVVLGQEMQLEKENLQLRVEEALQSARQEADKIIEEGRKTAEEIAKRIEDSARDKAERIVSEASLRLKEDAIRARAALEDDVAALVSDVAEAVIGKSMTSAMDTSQIKQAIKEQV